MPTGTATITTNVDGLGMAQSFRYPSLGRFLEDFLAPAYARQVTDCADTVWCPEPWLHPEALDRLGAMWQAREAALRSSNPNAVTEWWRDSADPTMHQLLSPSGPFKHCSVRSGHKQIPPLCMHFDEAPSELYLEVGSQELGEPGAAA